MKNLITKISVVIFSFALIFSGVSVANAQWVAPISNPPADNTPPPVNVGPLDQVKSGWLRTNNFFGNGRLGAREIVASQFCIAPFGTIEGWTQNLTSTPGNCITSWPTGGGSGLPTGALHNTLYYNGTNWVPNSEVLSDGNKLRVGTVTPMGVSYKLAVDGKTLLNGNTFVVGNTYLAGGDTSISGGNLYVDDGTTNTSVLGSVLTNTSNNGRARWMPVPTELPATANPDDVLAWNGTSWVAQANPTELPTTANTDDILTWDGNEWVAGTNSVNDGLIAGDTLRWDGSEWTPSSFLFNSNGNPWYAGIGIGTTSPKNMLDVRGSVGVGPNAALMGNLYWDSVWKYVQPGWGGAVKFNNGDGNIEFITTDVAGTVGDQPVNSGWPRTHMVMTPQGTLGIGTTSPISYNGLVKLHSAGGAWVDGGTALATNWGNVSIGGAIAYEKLTIGGPASTDVPLTFHSGGTKVIGYNFTYDGQDKRAKNGGVSQIRLGDDGGMEFRSGLTGFGGTTVTNGQIPNAGADSSTAIKINAPTPVTFFGNPIGVYSQVDIPYLKSNGNITFQPSGVVPQDGRVLTSAGGIGRLAWANAFPSGGTDGQVLTWNSTTNTWEWADTLPAGSSGDVLVWDTTLNNGDGGWGPGGTAIDPGTANDTLRWDATANSGNGKWVAMNNMNNDGSHVSIVGPFELQMCVLILGQGMQCPDPVNIFSALAQGGSQGNPTISGLRVYRSGVTHTNSLLTEGSATITGNTTVGTSTANRFSKLFGKLTVNVNTGVIAEFLGTGDVKIKPGSNSGQVTIGSGTTTGVPLFVNGNVYAQALPEQYQTPTGWIYNLDQNFTCGNTPQRSVSFNSDLNTFLSNASNVMTLADIQAACSSTNGVNGNTIATNVIIKSSNTSQSCASTNPGYINNECSASIYTAPSSSAPEYLYEVYASSWNNGAGFPLPLPSNGSMWSTNFQISVNRYQLQEGQVTGSQGNFIGNGAKLSSLEGSGVRPTCSNAEGWLIPCDYLVADEAEAVSTEAIVYVSTPGFTEWERTTNVVAASCPAGYKVISGGVTCPHKFSNGTGGNLLEGIPTVSRPNSSGTAWEGYCAGILNSIPIPFTLVVPYHPDVDDLRARTKVDAVCMKVQ